MLERLVAEVGAALGAEHQREGAAVVLPPHFRQFASLQPRSTSLSSVWSAFAAATSFALDPLICSTTAATLAARVPRRVGHRRLDGVDRREAEALRFDLELLRVGGRSRRRRQLMAGGGGGHAQLSRAA